MGRQADIPSHIRMCHCTALTADTETQAEGFRDGHERRESSGDPREHTCSRITVRKQEDGMEPE